MSAYKILLLIPKNLLSLVVGKVMKISLPPFMANGLIKAYCRFYGVNTQEIAGELSAFRSLSQFFTRQLRAGLRTVESGVVSPVDGYLVNWGVIEDGAIVQVKGSSYKLSDFLGDSELATSFLDGHYFTIYLSPSDYHWVHTPVAGVVTSMIHIPGKLWPVNSWSLSAIPNLFVVNERVHAVLSAKPGIVAVSMVGATNVGSINVVFDQIKTNRAWLKCPWLSDRKYKIEKRNYGGSPPSALTFAKGAPLGYFDLGSTVIILLQKGMAVPDPKLTVGPIKLGQRIAVTNENYSEVQS